MKTSIGVLLVAMAIGGGLAFSQGQDQKDDPAKAKDDAAKKIEVLENDLITTRQKCEAVSTDLAETKAAVARITQYLDAQARSASAMAAILDESEQAGFTAGINPNSRTILLTGWREQLNAQQQNVPQAVSTPPTKDDTVKPGDAKKPK